MFIFFATISTLFANEATHTSNQILIKGTTSLNDADIFAILQIADLESAGLSTQSTWHPLIPPSSKRRDPKVFQRVGLDRWYVLDLPENQNLTVLIQRLQKNTSIQYAEPNYIGQFGGQPNDPLVDRQWAWHNTGLDNGSTAGVDVQAFEAWDIETGSVDVIVAVLDTGLNVFDPDIQNNLWINPGEIPNNNIDDDGNGYIDDIHGYDFVYRRATPLDGHGHGSNVAGIIGMEGNNGLGLVGGCWNCKIMSGKNLSDEGPGTYDDWAESLVYAVDQGANIINMSEGGYGSSNILHDAITYAYLNNIAMFVATMNDNGNYTAYPAIYPEVFAVGSTDWNDNRSSPFDWDPNSGSNYGSHLTMSAPGSHIFSLSTLNGNYSYYYSGTSQATPTTAALAALLLSKNPTLTKDEIGYLITKGSVDQVGRPNEDTPGWDHYHGFGRINYYESLRLLVDEDNDGWSPFEGDCDDTNPNLNLSDNDGDGYTTCPAEICYQVQLQGNQSGWDTGFLSVVVDGALHSKITSLDGPFNQEICLYPENILELYYEPSSNEQEKSVQLFDAQNQLLFEDGPNPQIGWVFTHQVPSGETDCDDQDPNITSQNSDCDPDTTEPSSEPSTDNQPTSEPDGISDPRNVFNEEKKGTCSQVGWSTFSWTGLLVMLSFIRRRP